MSELEATGLFACLDDKAQMAILELMWAVLEARKTEAA